MKRTNIDFAPRSLRRTLFRTPGRSAALLLNLVLLGGIVVSQVMRYQDEREQRKDDREGLHAVRPVVRAASASDEHRHVG